MRTSIQAHKILLTLVVAIELFALVNVVGAATYDSCLDAYESGQTSSGIYDIDGLDNAYCDMRTNGGGWLRITPEFARDELNGEIRFEDGRSDTDYGFDSSDRPYTRDDTGAHTAHYTFDLPVRMTQFFLQDYYARSNSASDDSSDIYESRFRQRDWNEAHDKSVGDISFGFADDRGPVTSFAKELNDDVLVQQYRNIAWPADEEVFETGDDSDQFRIGWGDEGAPSEGWFPWWSGYILVRERDAGEVRDDLKIDIRSIDIESDNDVEFRTKVSGDPQDEDAKIRVEYEDNEGGNCRGDWERAEVKDGATATNEDGSNEPSVDNGDSYQIGSDSRHRVIADGNSNTVKFKWDAEEDLGNNPEGEYCVRVTIRSDSGEDDTDTYKVDFGGGVSSGDLEITNPDDGDSLPPNVSPRISGEGTDKNNSIVVTGPRGQRCNAIVNSNRDWNCRLSPVLDTGKNEICALERDTDGDRVDEVCIDVYVGNIVTPRPQPVGGVRINLPLNGATLDTNNPAIIGTGVAGSTIQVEVVGKTCTATVFTNGGWTCTLTLLPAGTYTVVATQRSNYGAVTGTATSGFTILGKQCPVFTQYHKLGQSGGEIPQIQEFLKKQGYYRGVVSGYYDFATDQAIRSFQLEFRSLILDPWRLPSPTGNWYKTSRKHANFLSGCFERVTLEGIGVTF